MLLEKWASALASIIAGLKVLLLLALFGAPRLDECGFQNSCVPFSSKIFSAGRVLCCFSSFHISNLGHSIFEKLAHQNSTPRHIGTEFRV